MKLFGKRSDIAFLVFVAMFSVVQQGRGKLFAPFWDYRVYVHALDHFRAGASPYGAQALPFVYPPIFLNLFGHAPFALLYALFVAASLALVVRCVWLARSSDFGFAAALGFLTGGSGVGGLLTGNFAIFAHLLVVAAFYAATRSDARTSAKYGALALLIVLFASIKIYFLAYAPVFLFVPKGARYFALAALGVAVVGVAQLALELPLWTAFESTLRYQMLTVGDDGLVLPGVLRQHLPALSTFADTLVHVLIVCALFAYAVNPLRAPRAIAAGDRAGKLFYVLAFAIALNPRMKEYDIAPFFACCFLSAFLNRHADDKHSLAFLWIAPSAFIAAWIAVKLTHWFGILHAAWVIGIYALFALASLRQRARRLPLVAVPTASGDGDLTVAP